MGSGWVSELVVNGLDKGCYSWGKSRYTHSHLHLLQFSAFTSLQVIRTRSVTSTSTTTNTTTARTTTVRTTTARTTTTTTGCYDDHQGKSVLLDMKCK